MTTLQDYIASIEKDEHKEKFSELMDTIQAKFPQLQLVFKWNEPMYTYNGTFIISFNKTKTHITVSPEVAGIKEFSDKIAACGYEQGKSTFHIKWEEAIHYQLLYEIIQFNLDEKQNYPTFWRKAKN
ncbi:MAG: DUF1801 domain-containing protein [Tetragenococcus sp.]|nr:DUF1801 domain-containing protein [Tetragenococcus sp.]